MVVTKRTSKLHNFDYMLIICELYDRVVCYYSIKLRTLHRNSLLLPVSVVAEWPVIFVFNYFQFTLPSNYSWYFVLYPGHKESCNVTLYLSLNEHENTEVRSSVVVSLLHRQSNTWVQIKTVSDHFTSFIISDFLTLS